MFARIFERRRLEPSPKSMSISEEAAAMEAAHGPARAIRLIREEIAMTGQAERCRLYKLHDEIMRRQPPGFTWDEPRLN